MITFSINITTLETVREITCKKLQCISISHYLDEIFEVNKLSFCYVIYEVVES